MLFLFFTTSRIGAQKASFIDNPLLPQAEKIYLQLDRNVYSLGQTLWFKAIVTQGLENKPTQYSGVLYAEFIDSDGALVDQKIVKLTNGTGHQFFDIGEAYRPGRYLVRGYTQWSRNFGNAMFYKEHITILDPDREQDPIKVTLNDTQQDTRKLRIDFFPDVADAAHEGPLTVTLDTDGNQRKLHVNKIDDGYKLEHDLPAKNKVLTLSAYSRNGKTFSKTIVLDKDKIDLQFLPEGGKLVHGLPCKIGFKALNGLGKGIKVEGTIQDEQGNTVQRFQSDPLGMGYFAFVPDSSLQYRAFVQTDTAVKAYPFPKVHRSGKILTISKNEDAVRFAAYSSHPVNDSIFLALKLRGKTTFLVKGFMKDREFAFTMPSDELLTGIYAACWFNTAKEPISERLFFNHNQNLDLPLQLQSDKTTYLKREQVTIEIAGTVSDLSILAIDRSQLGLLQEKRQNIRSYFLLDSELKGRVENPGYYFQDDMVYHDRITSLMLTQGWRSYNYAQAPKPIRFTNQPVLEVSGRVNVPQLQKKEKNRPLVTMITVEDNPQTFMQPLDGKGRFYFDMNNRFGEQLDVILQTTNNAGKTRDYEVEVDRVSPERIQYDNAERRISVDSTITMLLAKDRERKQLKSEFEVDALAVQLNEVVVTADKMDPMRKKVIDHYGKPLKVLDGDDIRNKEKEWSSGLYSVLRHHYPEVRVTRVFNYLGENFTYAHIVGTFGPTLISIDGTPVHINSYGNLDMIPTEDIKRIDLIRHVKDYQSLLRQTFPSYVPEFGRPVNNSIQLPEGRGPIWLKIPYVPSDVPRNSILNFDEVSLISVYTHSNSWLDGLAEPKGLNQISVPLFSPEKQFYAPKYESLNIPDGTAPDKRAVLHWQPRISMNGDGKASISFHNSDNLGEVMVIVEAIAPDGRIAHKSLTYVVKDSSGR